MIKWYCCMYVFVFSVSLVCFLAHKSLWIHCIVIFSWQADKRCTVSHFEGRQWTDDNDGWCKYYQISSMHAPLLCRSWSTCSLYSTSEHEYLLGNCLTLIKEQGRNFLLKWHLTVCISMTSVHCYEWKSWSFVLLSHPGAYIAFKNTTMSSVSIMC